MNYSREFKPQKKKIHREKSDLITIQNILPDVGKSIGLEKKTQEMAVLGLWRQMVPPAYGNDSRAMALRPQGGRYIMQVRVRDGNTASNLSFELEGVKQRINSFARETGIVIERIELGVGRLAD